MSNCFLFFKLMTESIVQHRYDIDKACFREHAFKRRLMTVYLILQVYKQSRLKFIREIFFYFLFTMEALSNLITVSTECGRIQGTTEKTLLDRREFYSFKGIPYAKPPIGSLRFKVSQNPCHTIYCRLLTNYFHSAT